MIGSSAGPAGQVADELRAMGGEAVANGDDVSDFDGAARMIPSALDTFGHLVVLVNDAGILRDRMLVNMTPEEWDAVMRVHLRGTLLRLGPHSTTGDSVPERARPTTPGSSTRPRR